MLAGKGFAAFPAGIGRRILILSNSGGPGVLCADQADTEGLDLVALPERMAASLRAAMPGEASVANPLDLLADAREDRFGLTFEAALREGRTVFDAVLGIHVVPFMVDADPVVARLAALAPEAGMPFLHSMMGTLPGKADWFAKLAAAGVACFDDVESMAECAGLLARYPALRAEAAAETRPIRLRGRGAG
jgi:acyl-CoA synthetase (NDP forming)